MSLFKTNPEIFCNGKFQVLASDVVMDLMGVERWITNNGVDCFVLIIGQKQINVKEGVDSCTLIARPIESMTDEELWDLSFSHKSAAFTRRVLHDLSEKNQVNVTDLIYLLRRGIYPGPQSDFDNGNVIRKEE